MYKFLKAIGALGLSAFIIFGQAYSAEDLREVKLPAENLSRGMRSSASAQNAIQAYNPFSLSQKTVLRDPATGSPRRVIGAPEKITGYSTINSGNIEQAANSFLKSKESELGLKGIDLKLRRMTHVNGRWYVTYQQTYKGIEVLLTEVELRIFDNGNVAMYGADVIPNVNLDTRPVLSYDAAVFNINKELNGKGSVDKLQSSAKTYILPIKTANGVACKLAYRAEIVSPDRKRFINYADANEGGTIWRFEKTKYASNKISVKGMVRSTMATDTPTEVCLPDLKMKVGGIDYDGDSKGETNVDAETDLPFKLTLSGKYARVTMEEGYYNDMEINDTLRNGQPLNILLNDNNSHRFERSVYRYVNDIHSDLKNIDPDITAMDFPMTLIIQFSGDSPNAGSAGDTIYYFAAENNEVNMPETPSILYHEYTHSINGLLYEELGLEDGMVNGSANEGMADVYACLIQQQPKVGLGAYMAEPGKYIRCIENNNIYPDSLSFDTHFNGQILAGAFWDLAKTTSVDFVKKLSHFVKYATPDDPDIGKAFSEWFLETIVADDNDGDLSNGTPHINEIIAAFNKHHIGTDLLLTQTFNHTPVNDTQDTLNPIPVVFHIGTPTLLGAGASNLEVMYSVDNGATYTAVPATAQDEEKYLANIPAQPAGSFIKYYIKGADKVSKREINFIKDVYSKQDLSFLVGYKTASMDNCENAYGWDIDLEDAQAYSGSWECADPGLVDFTAISGGRLGRLQPGDDHSAVGSKCFVTDGTAVAPQDANGFMMHAVIGRTSLITPEISLAGFTSPVLKFWRYSYLEILTDPTNPPYLRVYISTDNGDNWKLAETYTETTDDWSPSLINVNYIYPGAQSVKLKFIADNSSFMKTGGINICESLIDDIEVLATNGTVGVKDVNASNALEVYPNPAADYLRVSTNEPGVITITNSLGVIQYEAQANAGNNSVNLGAFPAGMYFVKLSNSNGVNLCKFVKK